ncbi:transposase [Streptomyces sp. SM10]|uniref:transposase n=1 Tax=Streptomyces sp. SM10 TaxID=565556 RepID=UPI0035BC3FFF
MREVAERLLQELIEAEATAQIGAEWNEQTAGRTGYRNGHRDRTVTTQAGDLEPAIPKLRAGSFFPSLLERRRRVDQAVYAVVMEAYVHGVSTRGVDDPVGRFCVRRTWVPAHRRRALRGFDLAFCGHAPVGASLTGPATTSDRAEQVDACRCAAAACTTPCRR